MSPDRPRADQRAGFFPNPNETVPPPTARDAIEDALRYAATSGSRAEVIENMRGIDPLRIVQAVQGRMVVRPPLHGFELYLANTVDGCVRHGLLKNPLEAITTLLSVRFDLLEGHGVFVGQERIPN